ncbi:PIG-L deacetylase family protein [Streptomyces sp. NPDC000594]|uniref:PIG-L deacetylase family protein n=1 Tax=Streptomyces sp. NPDC000594 TaxID=3154261 RepID=UPI00333474DA
MDHTHRPERVLAVAAHADDEILGAGGTLAVHTLAGDPLMTLILSHSATSRPTGDDQVRAHRADSARKVAGLYRAELRLADFPDNAFDTVPRLAITQTVEDAVRAWAPTVVYTHSTADLSHDHRLTAEAVAAATRPQPGSTVRTVLAFEVRSATEWGCGRVFSPTWFQTLTPEAAELKRRALAVYGSEMRPWPHTRSTRALDAQTAVRGAQVGVPEAEAFELIRHRQPPRPPVV